MTREEEDYDLQAACGVYPGSYGTESFTYDRVGNRQTHQTRQGENHTYVVDAADQLTEIRDTNTSALLYSFTHDAAGRRTGMTPSVGPSTSYEYDAQGKLTRLARSDGYSVRLAYGPHGGPYRRQETGFSNAYYLNAWAEHRSDQAVRLVRAGPGGAVVAEISGGMVRGLVRDGLANASHVTVGGTLASVRRYGGFGDILSGPLYPFVERGFAGHSREGRSGLVYMRARHYDPLTGRFLQADPLGINADQLYAYAANNPYRFFDPLGLGPISYAEPMRLEDLQAGHVLLTGDQGSAQYLTFGGEYGHAAIVLEPSDGSLQVLSSDNRGRYIDTNVYGGVGGRSYDVLQVPGLDVSELRLHAEELAVEGGWTQYLGIGEPGTNICSEVVAEAISAAGGPNIEGGLLLTPNELGDALGPPVGRVYVPLLEEPQ